MNKFHIVVLALLVSMLAGCGAGLSALAVPNQGRYTVVVRQPDVVSFQMSGKEWFAHTPAEFLLPVTLAENLRDGIKEGLANRPYEYIETTWDDSGYQLPPYTQADGYAYLSRADYGVLADRDEAFQARIRQFAREHQLDFVIVADQWSMADPIKESDALLEGAGVRFMSYYGWRKVHAYSNYRLQVIVPDKEGAHETRLESFRQINASEWIDIYLPKITEEVAREYLEEINATQPAPHLNIALCKLGLLLVPKKSPNRFVVPDCENTYPPREYQPVR